MIDTICRILLRSIRALLLSWRNNMPLEGKLPVSRLLLYWIMSSSLMLVIRVYVKTRAKARAGSNLTVEAEVGMRNLTYFLSKLDIYRMDILWRIRKDVVTLVLSDSS